MQPIEHNFERQSYEQNDTGPDHFANSNEAPTAGSAPTTEQIKLGNPAPVRPVRWMPRKKAEIVAAIRDGYMSLEEARERYALSIEEYISWQTGIELSGLAGLRINRLQQNRRRRKHSAER
jgi:hypothetical protein